MWSWSICLNDYTDEIKYLGIYHNHLNDHYQSKLVMPNLAKALSMLSKDFRPRKIDSEKSVTFEKTECATRVLHFISRIFQMKYVTDVNDFF